MEAGVVELVGTDPGRIVNAARRLLTDPDDYRKSEATNPYGDGKAAESITAAIRDFFER